MNIYAVISTILVLSMFFAGFYFYAKNLSSLVENHQKHTENKVNSDQYFQYLRQTIYILNRLGFTPWPCIDIPISGVTYTCINPSVVIIKLKSDRKCGGFFINGVSLYLDLSAHCEIYLREGDTFCLHTHIEIEYYKFFESINANQEEIGENKMTDKYEKVEGMNKVV